MFNKKLTSLVLPLVTTLSLQANDPFFQDPFGDDIFKEMMQMQKNMDEMFKRMHNRMQQRSNRLVSPLGTYKIAQTQTFVDKGNHYEHVTNIPENKENQIDITTKDGIISITAKIIEKHENKTNNSYSSSSSMRMYQQSMPLPGDADEGTMKAEYKQGKLVITINKLKNMPKSKTNIHINGTTNSTSKAKENEKTKEKHETKEQNNTKKKITITSDIPSMS